MKPEDRALLVGVVAVVVVATIGGAYFLLVPTPPSLPLMAGIAILVSDYSFVIPFTVPAGGGRLVGAYIADTGLYLNYGPAGTNGGRVIHSCWTIPVQPTNYTLDWSIPAGQYVLFPWCGRTPATVTVTETIQVVAPG